MDDLIGFYDAYDEGARLTRARSRNLEWLATMRFLDEYVPDGARVADIGAGEGAYALELASRSKEVVAIDLVPSHAESIARKARERGLRNIRAFAGDARRLEGLDDASFDAVLCLGPLYHLRLAADRRAVIDECARILKPGGVAFFAYINRAAALLYFIKNGKYPDNRLYAEAEKANYGTPLGVDRFMDLSFFSDPDLARAEAESAGFTAIAEAGVDGIAYFIHPELEAMPEDRWRDYSTWHLSHCGDRSTFGMSMHGLLVCGKA
jgi:ubiquinone/menaquinone biosynthesis C-methylase UbiE